MALGGLHFVGANLVFAHNQGNHKDCPHNVDGIVIN